MPPRSRTPSSKKPAAAATTAERSRRRGAVTKPSCRQRKLTFESAPAEDAHVETVPDVASSDTEEEDRSEAAAAAAAAAALPPLTAAEEKELKAFDLDSTFGPCLGLTRLERFLRAEKLQINPPPSVREILHRVHPTSPSAQAILSGKPGIVC